MATQTNSESTTVPIAEQLSVIGNRLRVVEIDVAVIKSNYATREDIAKTHESIAKLEVRLIRWFVGTALTLTGMVATIAFAAAKFIH
jgi:hypothetical protein